MAKIDQFFINHQEVPDSMGDKPRMDFIRTRLRKYTFDVTKIREWVETNCEGKVLNLFAGYNKLNVDEIRNDLDPNAPADYHLDCLDFVRNWQGHKFDTIVLDPPYALRKSMELYEGRKVTRFKLLADALPRILNKGGCIISFGYHTTFMGKGNKATKNESNRGFDLEALCVFAHGGSQHATIAIIERCSK